MRRVVSVALLVALAGIASAGPIMISGARSGSAPADVDDFPLGALGVDGAAMPEQISLVLPVTDTLATTATASCEYKATAGSSWIDCHPLHRVRTDYAEAGGPTVDDVFAWPVLELTDNTSYDFRVEVCVGATCDTKTLTTSTRAIPAASGVTTVSISAGSSVSTIATAINGASAGAVIQLADATYSLSATLSITNTNGTAGSPIYVRGASRDGTVLSRTGGTVVTLAAGVDNIIFERLTIDGSGVDSGTSSSSGGIVFSASGAQQSRITIRNVTITDVDTGITAPGGAQEILVYDNLLEGNNAWTQDFYSQNGSGAPGAGDGTPDIEQNVMWNDDGIGLPGLSNAAFHNTIGGFGDTFTVTVGSDGPDDSRSIYYYANDVLMGGDDPVEFDKSFRTLVFCDNRVHNAGTLASLSDEGLYGGPVLICRNIGVNLIRGPWKLNAPDTGHFLLSNTTIREDGTTGWGWVQFDNGDQQAWGYQNNLQIYRGTGQQMAMEAGGQNDIDFTNNGWYPDAQFWWTNSGSSYGSLAAAKAGVPSTTPVFSGQTKRHTGDVITVNDPFATDCTLGADHETEITSPCDLTLSDGTTPRNAGVAIPGITDGFTGAAPDMGAMIHGRSAVTYGDRTP